MSYNFRLNNPNMRFIFFLSITGFALWLVPLQASESPFTFSGDLPRRAHLGFETQPVGDAGLYDAQQLAVRAVETATPAARAGLATGDVIIAVNGQAMSSALDAYEFLGNLPGEQVVELKVRRNGGSQVLRFMPASEPPENLRGVHTTYGVLRMADGTPLRTLLTRPLNSKGRLPAVLFSDWTTCSSTEVPHHIDRGWRNLLRGIVTLPGMIVLRIDKPGVGDSLGRCSDLDFDTTVAYQRKGLQWLKARPDVDPERIFVMSQSVGGYMAPLVARGENVAGIFTSSAGATTWFERMVTFERYQRELSARPLSEIDAEMKRIIRFFHYYLELALPLEEIFKRDPAMREVWSEQISHNSETRHYGRPVTFHQQAQRHDYAKAWIDSGARVLVSHGEFDQYDSLEAAQTIVNAVNSVRPGWARLVVYPGMNHSLEIVPSAAAALAGVRPPVPGAEPVLEDLRKWVKEVLETNE